MKLTRVSGCLILMLPGLAFAEIHREVQDALDYHLPENTCSKPKIIESSENVTPPAQAAGSAELFVGSSSSEVSDMDSYTRKRLQKKERRWRTCVAKYKVNLLEDMEELKSSASHGLTQEQANAILTHMAFIQKVYMTEDGVLEE